jgi:hypothetical protein
MGWPVAVVELFDGNEVCRGSGDYDTRTQNTSGRVELDGVAMPSAIPMDVRELGLW